MKFARIIASFVLSVSVTLSVIALFALLVKVEHPFAPFSSFSLTDFLVLTVIALLVKGALQELPPKVAAA